MNNTNEKYIIPKEYKKPESWMLKKDRKYIYKKMRAKFKDERYSQFGPILQQLYDYDSENYFIGIHRTLSSEDEIFQKGIKYKDNTPDFDNHVQIFRNFPAMLMAILNCESYKGAAGCFIIKVPKRDVRSEYANENTMPIYYKDSYADVYLRPEYISAYVRVKNKEIQYINFNKYPHNIYNINTEFLYDERVEDTKRNRM